MRRRPAARGDDQLAAPGDTVERPNAPQPGPGELPALVDRVRAAGVPVRLDVVGTPQVLPAMQDMSAYRIVQEALTNTMKHAGEGAEVVVRVRFGGDGVEVEVTDDGTGGPPRASGPVRRAGRPPNDRGPAGPAQVRAGEPAGTVT